MTPMGSSRQLRGGAKNVVIRSLVGLPATRLGGLEVDNRFEIRRLNHRQFGGLGAL
jgi:hypothetical protein